MAANKTRPTTASVTNFITSVANDTRRKDSFELLSLYEKITGHTPVLWGSSIIGFGSYHYKYDSGREGDMLMAGFSPRKQNLALYNTGFKRYPHFMERLGRYKVGSSCLYINRLSDVDKSVLAELLGTAFEHMKMKYQGEMDSNK